MRGKLEQGYDILDIRLLFGMLSHLSLRMVSKPARSRSALIRVNGVLVGHLDTHTLGHMMLTGFLEAALLMARRRPGCTGTADFGRPRPIGATFI